MYRLKYRALQLAVASLIFLLANACHLNHRSNPTGIPLLRDVEFEELRKKNARAKLAAMDMANTSGADKARMMALEMWVIWICAFRCLPPAGVERDVELVEPNAMNLKTLLSAGESHKAQIGKLKDILRATDVELMDLQNKNEQIKSTVKSLQNKLLAAETSRHKQTEAATRSTELTRQLKEVFNLNMFNGTAR
ncbi:hypothetical protein C8J57DRAFT_1240488 [Mycena rebaudengoi]|nr:hypothetical protein C8J57DRAFT_1240488 [Mycena rebaudengoi]